MSALDVRSGFERYGAAVFLNKQMELVKIWRSSPDGTSGEWAQNAHICPDLYTLSLIRFSVRARNTQYTNHQAVKT
jgi:hypothetical protein